ncbi:MAG TPA: alpha-L-arabinofuranosidase C-terminal domain-containing protein [Verrucomicrobiae bacterium]|nr:alpha-L-arabinofuranosidase C-terminal domain-containing protein [Verrucomicrobiae bacterium]
MKKPFLSLVLLCAASVAVADPTLTIRADKIVKPASPMLYGLMTEEINHSYDGGLYAELIQNRAFLDDSQTPKCWSLVQNNGAAATMALDTGETFNGKVSLRLDVTSASKDSPAGVANEGYWGIPVFPSTRYHACFYAKASPTLSGPVAASIVSDDGATVYASARVSHLSSDWKMYQVTLKTGRAITPTAKTRFLLSVENPGTVWLGCVSLFPPTWKNQPNGFRKDLLQMLINMNPKFLRLPGGNYLEGNTIPDRFDWKKTIGPVIDRPGHDGPWGYRSTDGLGFLEYLRWCEDMNAEPVLAVYAGYSLNHTHVKPGIDLEPYVQDALDEIEYVTGATSTKWGAKRAKDGHPKPFPLHYVEIGNEDWFDGSGSYDERFTQFYKAIKAKYPQLQCISTIGNDADANLRVRSSNPDVLDEHYYRSARVFLRDASHFDNYDRNGPRIFVGEWAAHESTFPPWDRRSADLPPTPNMKAALADAAWMTGMERNSDLIQMQSYAPLMVNVNPGARQWRPDLIGYDTLHCYGSPSYYAIKIFANNLGDQIPAVTSDDSTIYDSVTENSKTGAIIIKLVNAQTNAQTLKLDIQGARLKSDGTAVTLAAAPDATNSIDNPTNVVPVVTKVTDIASPFSYTVPANSIVVLALKSK